MSRLHLLGLMPRPLRLLALRQITAPGRRARRLVCRIARTSTEFDTAARLLHDCYVEKGMMSPHPCGRRDVPQLRQPGSFVVIVLDDDRIVGTAGLASDGPLGLPTDAIHPEELAKLRRNGRRLVEACAMALAPGYRRSGAHALMGALLVHMGHIVLNADDLIITTAPAGVDVYEAALSMRPFTSVRTNPSLGAHVPSQGLVVALATLEERLRRRDRFWPAGALDCHWVYFRHPWPGLERLPPQEALEAQRSLLASLESAKC